MLFFPFKFCVTVFAGNFCYLLVILFMSQEIMSILPVTKIQTDEIETFHSILSIYNAKKTPVNNTQITKNWFFLLSLFYVLTYSMHQQSNVRVSLSMCAWMCHNRNAVQIIVSHSRIPLIYDRFSHFFFMLLIFYLVFVCSQRWQLVIAMADFNR